MESNMGIIIVVYIFFRHMRLPQIYGRWLEPSRATKMTAEKKTDDLRYADDVILS